MRLIFVRHPQTQANVQRLIYGRTESDYSEAGRATIPEIVKGLSNVRIDVLISSPLKRTRYLAEQIAGDHGLRAEDILIEERVTEVHCGVLEQLTKEEAIARYPAEYKALTEDYDNYVVPEGESFSMVKERVIPFLEELYEKYEEPRNDSEGPAGSLRPLEKTVVVVAHSALIHAALAHLLKIDLKEIWHLKIEPGAMVDLDYRHGFAMLQGLSGPFNVRPIVGFP